MTATTTADLVKDTSTSVGAGNIVLAGAPPVGFQPFTTLPGAAPGVTFGYKVANRAVPSEVEVGIGTIVAMSPFQYSRAPKGGAAALVFSAGTKDVEQVITAAEFLDFAKVSDGVTATALNDAGPLLTSDVIVITRIVSGAPVEFSSTFAALATLLGASSDITAPTLTSATAAANGPNAATGSVTTNEGNGTLFSMASANASETSAAVIAAGIQQAITSAGAKTVAISGLSPNTTYRLHHAHRDQSGNVATTATSSATFTTAAAAAVPSTMAAPTLTAGDGKVSVAWVVPALNGGTFVSATFTASTGQTLTVNATTSPVDFTLPNGTAVTITGKVTNSLGPAAAASPLSNSVTPVSSSTMASLYTITTGENYPATATFEGGSAPNQYWATGFNIYIKDASGNAPANPGTFLMVWGKSPTVPPITYSGGAWPAAVPYAANGGSSGNAPNSVKGIVAVNASYPGLFATAGTMYGGGSAGTYYPHVLCPDGSSKACATGIVVS